MADSVGATPIYDGELFGSIMTDWIANASQGIMYIQLPLVLYRSTVVLRR